MRGHTACVHLGSGAGTSKPAPGGVACPRFAPCSSRGEEVGRGTPHLPCHPGPHGKSLRPLLPTGKARTDTSNTAPRNLNSRIKSEDAAMRVQGPRERVCVARAEPQPGPGVTGGRPTWAMADSQRLMLSVWRKCKPVAWEGKETRTRSSSRGSLRAEPRPRPGGLRSWGSRRHLPRGLARTDAGRRAPWGGCPAGHRGQRGTNGARNPAGQTWGRRRGRGGLAAAWGGPARPGSTAWGCRLGVAESACELSYRGIRGIPKPAQRVSLAATDNVQPPPLLWSQRDDQGDALRPRSVQVRTTSGVSPCSRGYRKGQ